MNHQPDTGADFLYGAPQPMVRRLYKRANAPIGVIDTKHSQAHYLRLTEWLSGRFALTAQLKSRRQSGDGTLAASGVFVYRQLPPHPPYHADTPVHKEIGINHSGNTSRATGVVINRAIPDLPAISPGHSTYSKTQAFKILPADIFTASTYSEINATTVNITAKEIPAASKLALKTIEEKLEPVKKSSENQPQPKSEEQQTVWRLRRISIHSLSERNHSEIIRTQDFRSTAIEKTNNFSTETSQSAPDRFFVIKQMKNSAPAADTSNVKTEKNLILRDTIQANQQDTLPGISTPETKIMSHSKSPSAYSKTLIDKELPLDSSPYRQLGKKARQHYSVTNAPADLADATENEWPYSIPKQSLATSDTPLIWQRHRISTPSFLRQQKNVDTNPATEQASNSIPELAFRVSGASQPEYNYLESLWKQNEHKADLPDKQSFQSESEHTRNRLSKREWSQLVDRVSRVIWNKLIVDLDRRGIRVWR